MNSVPKQHKTLSHHRNGVRMENQREKMLRNRNKDWKGLRLRASTVRL